MKKAQKMDQLLAEQELSVDAVFQVVHEVFGFDLDKVPLVLPTNHSSREVVAEKLIQQDAKPTGQQIRAFINELFSVNLEALSALEGAGLSLYAKGRWVIEEPTDCFVIYSEIGDRVTRVFTTTYYAHSTGTSSAPVALQETLQSMGYTADTTASSFYFESDTAVPDAFKGQTIGAVLQNMPKVHS